MTNEEFPQELFELENFFKGRKKRKRKDGLFSADGFPGCVLLSRISLYRNLRNEHFPLDMSNSVLASCLEQMLPVAKESLGTLSKKVYTVFPHELGSEERLFLSERFFLNWETIAPRQGSALCVAKDRSCSVYLNGTDHVLMQIMGPGVCMDKLYPVIRDLDLNMGKALPWAFDRRLGYLTSSPKDLGTGMRVTYLLHLPHIIWSESIRKVQKGLSALHVDLKPVWKIGRVEGAFFELSNHSTLGESEEDIIARMEHICQRLVMHERSSVLCELTNRPEWLYHKIASAYGELRYSYYLTEFDCVKYLSWLLLGSELNMFSTFSEEEIADLIFRIRDGHLSVSSGEKLSPPDLQCKRGILLREFFNGRSGLKKK